VIAARIAFTARTAQEQTIEADATSGMSQVASSTASTVAPRIGTVGGEWALGTGHDHGQVQPGQGEREGARGPRHVSVPWTMTTPRRSRAPPHGSGRVHPLLRADVARIEVADDADVELARCKISGTRSVNRCA